MKVHRSNVGHVARFRTRDQALSLMPIGDCKKNKKRFLLAPLSSRV